MIWTDGEPTICSSGTKIKKQGISNYPKEKVKVIKDTDPEFLEEKEKMGDDWGIDKLIKEGGVMVLNPELTKKEQLKKIFVKKLTEVYFDSYEVEFQEGGEKPYIEKIADELLKEVSIRV